MLTQSAAAPLLADTPRFRSLSPSSKPMFHLKVTTSFSFTFCLKIGSGQILPKNKIKKQKVKEQSKQQHPTPYKVNSSTGILKQHPVLIITASAKSKSWPGVNQAAREV